MRTSDIAIYREVQRNAEMAMKAIDTVSDKVYNDELNRNLTGQIIKYSQIKNKALDKLYEAKVQPYHANKLSELMLVGGIHSKTILNTSTSHIAEMVIQGSSRGITEMQRVLNRNDNAAEGSVELAKELMQMEEKSIQGLKRFL